MEILRSVVILSLIILAIVIGSAVLYKDNFAVLTGTITAEASKSGTANINYPVGFNADNCVAISFGIKIIENKGFNYFGTYEDSADLLNNSYERKLNLNSTNIVAIVKNPTTSSNNIKYKIVLLKI